MSKNTTIVEIPGANTVKEAAAVIEHMENQSTKTENNSETDNRLPQLLELQEQMTAKITRIQEIDRFRDDATQAKQEFQQAIKDKLRPMEKAVDSITEPDQKERMETGLRAYKSKFFNKFMHLNRKAKALFSRYEEARDEKSKLWNEWHALQEKCRNLVGDDKNLWRQFFETQEKNQAQDDSQDLNTLIAQSDPLSVLSELADQDDYDF